VAEGLSTSWLGSVPAIHVLLDVQKIKKDVDARHKAGHDELSVVRF
jgi:hypothetical protein